MMPGTDNGGGDGSPTSGAPGRYGVITYLVVATTTAATLIPVVLTVAGFN